MRAKKTVAERRNYAVLDVKSARKLALHWLQCAGFQNVIGFGLPEVDDRSHVWRVPLVSTSSQERLGELVIDARTSLVLQDKSTDLGVLEARIPGKNGDNRKKTGKCTSRQILTSSLGNIIALGDSEDLLPDFPAGSVDLVFTSPPYYNARPEYTDFVSYEEYLLKLRKIIHVTHRVLSEGRFFVVNISPVLIRRANRNEASRRIAVPFDLHRIFVEEGYDFIDDIIWMKPEGAGWATNRGRRFAADRNPLQYKPVPITEYVLVYRKHTERLIDWNIRSHPSRELVKSSRINDDYERTNVWRITPAHDKKHPAIFPVELAERVIRYYSFRNDVVLDPFAGIGTVGRAAVKLGRRFVLIEQNPEYVEAIRDLSKAWLGKMAGPIGSGQLESPRGVQYFTKRSGLSTSGIGT